MESHIVGHPRVGTKREPKFPLKSFEDRTSSAKELLKAATDPGLSVGKQMAYINSGTPSNPFSYHDQVLDTKRFDTNYHLIALDVGPDGKSLYHKAVAEYEGAKAIHIHMCVNEFSNTVLSIMAAVADKITIDGKVLPVYREGVKINGAGIGPAAGVSPKIPTSTTSSTRLHIHSRHSNSNGIIHSAVDMDVTIENSRLDEKLLQSAFLEGVKYGAGIGPASVSPKITCATPTSTTPSALLHIHMSYANSNLDYIIDSIMDMDADVIIIDNSSRHDIHSQSMPSTEDIASHINKKLAKFETNILWVNLGYGLRTTKVKPALENMVAAAKLLRI